MTIYTARLDLALALRSPAPHLGDPDPDLAPRGGEERGGSAAAEGEARPAGPPTTDDVS